LKGRARADERKNVGRVFFRVTAPTVQEKAARFAVTKKIGSGAPDVFIFAKLKAAEEADHSE